MRSLESLRNRKTPVEEAHLKTFSAINTAAMGNESYEWLIEATQPIDVKYTNETFAQGDRVKAQLESNLDIGHCSEFEYQGSVTSDTHVKYHSDIDLLVLNGVYVWYPSDYPVPNPVSEGVLADSLMSLRKDSARILKEKFPQAKVDESKSKALAVSGGSLKRNIDVVLCHWWNTQLYLNHKAKANRGIQLLVADTGGRIGNMPFLHNWHINEKDNRVGGGLRKSIRLLKNLKYDKNPEASISSYDIAALSYNIPDSDLNVLPGAYFTLAKNTSSFLNALINDSQKRDSLFVPNGTRRVFGADGATLTSLKEITAELDSLLAEIPASVGYLIALTESVAGHEKTFSWKEARSQRVQDVTNKLSELI